VQQVVLELLIRAVEAVVAVMTEVAIKMVATAALV
jgi:hypothetical protein